jgi:arylformamidase
VGDDKIWLDYDQQALDQQYDQRALVPDANDYMARHAVLSADVRRRLDCRLDVAYGPTDDEVMDIFPTGTSEPSPVVVYIHGGAWTRWDKDHNSYQAPAFVDAGVSFASIDFALLPNVSLDELVRQCRTAVQWVFHHCADFGADPNKLYIAGHSSGAHVAGLLAVTNWARDWDLPTDVIKGVVAASGMYDLQPVQLSSRNEYLHLDDAAVARNSAMRQISERMPPMVIGYGENEQLEFRRQSQDFAAELKRLNHACTEFDMPGLNHFQMAEQFADADSPLMRACFQVMGIAD